MRRPAQGGTDRVCGCIITWIFFFCSRISSIYTRFGIIRAISELRPDKTCQGAGGHVYLSTSTRHPGSKVGARHTNGSHELGVGERIPR